MADSLAKHPSFRPETPRQRAARCCDVSSPEGPRQRDSLMHHGDDDEAGLIATASAADAAETSAMYTIEGRDARYGTIYYTNLLTARVDEYGKVV